MSESPELGSGEVEFHEDRPIIHFANSSETKISQLGDDTAPADAISPNHYRSHPSGIEAIQITKHESFLRGNIVKYVLRAPYKGHELEDLRKARQYLDWEIERVENA